MSKMLNMVFDVREYWTCDHPRTFPLELDILMASSHLASLAKRPNPKLLSRGEDKSPLKYIITIFLSNSQYFIEKKFVLSTRVWVSILGGPKLLPRGQTLWCQKCQKVLPCRHFGGLSPLEFGH